MDTKKPLNYVNAAFTPSSSHDFGVSAALRLRSSDSESSPRSSSHPASTLAFDIEKNYEDIQNSDHMYYFYQGVYVTKLYDFCYIFISRAHSFVPVVEDGQQVYLDPLNQRMLLASYGSYENLPDSIVGIVLSLEGNVQNEVRLKSTCPVRWRKWKFSIYSCY